MNKELRLAGGSRLPGILLVLLCHLAAIIPAQAQFTTGNVVVLQTGDGTAALTNASTAIFLKEYNTTTAAQAAPVSSVAIPVSGASRLTNSGSASSEGQITLSSDSLRIVISGYDTTIGIAGIASTTSASIARAVDTISILGIPGRAAATGTQFSGNNIRCATRNGGENYWAVGGTSGVYYLGNTATPAAIETSLASVKAILAANGNLYYSSSSGTPALYKITGQPTVAATPSAFITFASAASPYAFAINSAETMVYVADERTTAGGGIQQWSYNTATSSWTWVDTLSVGAGTGARGVTVDWSGTYPVIYAVTTDSRLVKIIDTNTSVSTYVTLATAPANAAFRSVVFSPKLPCNLLAATVTPATPTSFCSGGSFTLNANTGAGYTYQWNNASGPIAGATNASYTAVGTNPVTYMPVTAAYTVKVSSAGCSTTSAATTITINPNPGASITTLTSTTLCTGDTVKFNANSYANSFVWSTPNGPVIGGSTGPFTTYAFTSPGNYSITATSGAGCTSTSAVVTVIFNPLPVAAVTPSGTASICPGGSIILSANTGTGLSYQWMQGTTVLSGQTSATYTATAAGSYSVVVTNASGCHSTSPATVVTIGAAPTATVTPSGSVSYCHGSSITLTANTGTGYTYQWSNASGPIGGATNAAYTVTSAGAYTVTVSGGTTCNATSAVVTVTENPLPVQPGGASGPLSFCAGGNVALNAGAPAGTNTYQWKLNGSAISGATMASYITNATGSYKLIATSAAGCTDSSLVYAVTVNANPVTTVTASGPLTFCAGDSVQLTGINAAGNTYSWQNGSTLIAGATGSNYTVHNTGNYALTVITPAGCTGTSATTNVTVNAVPQPSLSFSGGVLGTDPFAGYQWYLNGIAIPGATGESWTPVHNGNYSVTVINAAGCSSSAGPLPVTSLGVNQISAALVSIYPNPARDAVHIDAPGVVNVQIKDMQGRVVLAGRQVKNLSIGSLDNGLYLITVFSEDGVSLLTQKLVKE